MKTERETRRSACAGAVFLLAAAMALLTGVILFLAGDAGTMEAEFRRFAPPERTGLPEAEYPAMAAHITDYLTGRKDSFQYMLESEGGESLPCFHAYEEIHMADCRELIRLDRLACGVSALIALAAAALIARGGRRGLTPAARGARRALGGLCLAWGGLALWAAVSFDGLFLTFHRLAFRNDLWLLDPRTDLLIRLMPEALFADLGFRGLGLFAAGLALLAGAAWAFGRKARDGAEDSGPEP